MLKQLISSIITLLLVALYYLMDESSYFMNEDVCGGNSSKSKAEKAFILPKLKYMSSGGDANNEMCTTPNIMEDYMESLYDENPGKTFKKTEPKQTNKQTNQHSNQHSNLHYNLHSNKHSNLHSNKQPNQHSNKHSTEEEKYNKYIAPPQESSRNIIYGSAFDLTPNELELKNRILNGEEPFPFKNRFQPIKNVREKFINLHNHKTIFTTKQFRIANFTVPRSKENTISALVASNTEQLFKHNPTILQRSSQGFLPNSKYAYVTIPIPDSAYSEKNDISDYFNEEVRMGCRRSDQSMSSLEYWQKNPKKILDYCFGKYYTISLEDLRETMYDLWYECTTFKSSCIVDFIRLFGAKSILDISAGWGDRLIGALSQGVKYVGVDPNTRLFPGYANIVKFAAETITSANLPNWKFAQPILICSPFETAKLPEGEFDMVFSSPPFFDLEIYSNEPTQSIKGKKTLKDWYDGFLRVVIIKAWGKLKIGGHLVLYINDIKNREPFIYNMLQDMDIWLRNAKTSPFYLGCVVQYNEKPARQPSFNTESKFSEFVTGGNSDVKYHNPAKTHNKVNNKVNNKVEIVQGQPFWIWRKVAN